MQTKRETKNKPPLPPTLIKQERYAVNSAKNKKEKKIQFKSGTLKSAKLLAYAKDLTTLSPKSQVLFYLFLKGLIKQPLIK